MAVLAVIALAIVAAGFMFLAKSGPSQQTESQTGPVARDPRIYGLGSVEARLLSRLGFEMNGTLARLDVDQGDRVQRGQILAALDVRDQQARVAVAEAGLRQAEAALTQARSRLDRARALNDQRSEVNRRRQTLAQRGTVSKESAEESQANAIVAAADMAVAASDVEAAKGGIDAARARLDLERAILEKSSLTAPFDGVIVERARELGSAVAPGNPVLTIMDASTIWISAFVDEALAGKLAVGQQAEIRLRSRPDEAFGGKIARIDLENDRVSEERRVQVSFDTIPLPVHLGEQAEVLIEAGESGQ